MRFLLRVVLFLLAIPLAALAVYTVAAFGALLLAPEANQPDEGVTVYACDNGVHTDLVVPATAPGADWRGVFTADAFTGPTELFDHLSIGWGSRDFYISTPTWADVDVATAVKSVLWDETVLRAIDKTEILPRDTDGRVPSAIVIEYARQE